ncbi:MAG TPA: DNA-binding domain-containing protein [Steroidobacteraceae bacterium]|nr:DNA-binding domain-containing protein [Steroidobacteraceae bacterium]
MNSAQIQLRGLQQDMQRYLLGEENRVTAAIVDAPPLPAADRLAIYRNAYQVRLIDALHDTYPVLHGLLGDEVWIELGQAYVAAHPSVFRSIRWYGRELADFMAGCAPYSDAPILSEVALLEWTLSEVFDATDAPAMQRADLSAVEPSAWGSLTFRFHPSLRRLSLSWNTAAVWKAMSSDETPPGPELADAPVPWLLWRKDLQNYFRSMNAVESAALDAAVHGSDFAQICEGLCALLPQEQIPAVAANLLGAWADGGIISGFGATAR